jgi:hypothetical protein
MPSDKNGRLDPMDYQKDFQRTANVEGTQFPIVLFEHTDAVDNEDLPIKAMCPQHLKHLCCSEHSACVRIHFRHIEMRADSGNFEARSAGSFAPTVGLIHFATESSSRLPRMCEDEQVQGTCPRGWRCTFLHPFRRSAGDSKRANQLIAEFMGDTPTKSSKRAAPVVPPRVGDVELFPTLTGVTDAAAPARAAPAAVPAAKKSATPAPPGATLVAGAKLVVASKAKVPVGAVIAARPAASAAKAPQAAPQVATQPAAAVTPPHGLPAPRSATAYTPNSMPATAPQTPKRNPQEDNTASTFSHPAPPASAQFPPPPPPVAPPTAAALSTACDDAPLTPEAAAEKAAFVLAAGENTPLTYLATPAAHRPAPGAVVSALERLVAHVAATPLSHPSYGSVMAACRAALASTAEFIAMHCEPIGNPASTDVTWVDYTRQFFRAVASSSTAISTTTIGWLLAAAMSKRPSCVAAVRSVYWTLANIVKAMSDPRARAPNLWERVDAVTALELCTFISTTSKQATERDAFNMILETVKARVYNTEGNFDYDTKRWAEAALHFVCAHSQDTNPSGNLSALALQTLSQRLDAVKIALNNENVIVRGIRAFESLTYQVEQVLSDAALRRWSLSCLLVDRCQPASGSHGRVGGNIAFAVTAPSGDPKELWLAVEIDPTRTLSFLQWVPNLFIGQYVSIQQELQPQPASPLSPSSSLQQQLQQQQVPAYRFLLMSVEGYRLYLKLAPHHEFPAAWRPGASQLRVTVEHNAWYLNMLVGAMRNPRAEEFIDQLTSHTLAPWRSDAPPISTIDLELYLDARQEQFVSNVLYQPRLVTLVGPPGTGKTHSIVAAIEMITKNRRGRVLACATSNYATNVLANFLKQLSVNVIRVFSRSTGPLDVRNSIFRELLEVSNEVKCPRTHRILTNPDDYSLDSEFTNASWEQLARYDVVCCTTAHTQWMTRCPVDFTFCFIDECAQATKAETLVPLSYLPATTTLVLAGDPKQLGPTILSDVAAQHGLATSFLAQYMPDVEDQNSPVLSSELLKNYRSHPDILSVFNRLFYNNRLESAAEFDKLTLVSCSFQRNKTFPLVFIDVPPHGGPSSAYVTGIQVANTEELANVSAQSAERYDSAAEADAVAAAVESLLRENGEAFADKIGVITSFRQQVMTIQSKLRAVTQADILVGTVDQYQGQERACIIISMVRHTKDSLIPLSKVPVGFVGHAQKTNVAISRAESLLIIVGYADGLRRHGRDEPWRAIVDHLQTKNAVTDVHAVRASRDDGARMSAMVQAATGRQQQQQQHPSAGEMAW